MASEPLPQQLVKGVSILWSRKDTISKRTIPYGTLAVSSVEGHDALKWQILDACFPSDTVIPLQQRHGIVQDRYQGALDVSKAIK